VGDPQDSFVVRASGFAPQTPVTVTMTAVGPPPASAPIMNSRSATDPVTGKNGTVTVTVNQIFPVPFQLGLYTVEVTQAGGARASTQFMVRPAAPPGG
jgi:hypothetical protein